jgi:hypothetical protein
MLADVVAVMRRLVAILLDQSGDFVTIGTKCFEGKKGIETARDRLLAAFFHRSNWTQEQIAKKEGKTQRWVSYRLLFGRFLHFRTDVLNTETLPNNLTEGRFLKYWERAPACGGNERQRLCGLTCARKSVHSGEHAADRRR